jgi:signal transduction histidine kinase/ActR/RegA family two-component response regulator
MSVFAKTSRIAYLSSTSRPDDPAPSCLANAGFAVLLARDVDGILDLAQRGDLDLVLVEFAPDGLAACNATRRLRREDAFADVPIVHVGMDSTVGSTEGVANDSFEAGADGRLSLGSDTRELVALARAFARLRHAERAACSRADALRMSSQKADEFMAMLGHELRNPLGALRTGLSLLDGCGDDAARAGRIRTTMARQTENLERIVDDMLDVTRITHGKFRLATRPIDLRDVVASTLDVARAGFDAHAVTLAADLGSERALVQGDVTRLDQIVANLLDNALKYTPAGGRVDVAITTVETQPPRARLRIKDSGAGIDRAHLADLFAPFFQGDTRSSRRIGGLGIGLTVVHRLVEVHGGTIRVASEGVGLGTEVTIELPLLPSSTRTSAWPDAGVDVPPASNVSGIKVSRRVLLVDDDVDSGDLHREVLQREGHVVSLARNGEEALDALLAHTFDAAVIDIGLPGIDGYGVALLTRESLGAHTPLLIALTGYAGPEARAAAQCAGFDVYLPKPVNTSELAATVASSRKNDRDSSAKSE